MYICKNSGHTTRKMSYFSFVTLLCLTSDSQPALWWCSNIRGALVESFIRHGNIVNGHLCCCSALHEDAIFVEISSEVGGVCLVSAAQSHIVSLHHRKDGTLQDHRTSWTTYWKNTRNMFYVQCCSNTVENWEKLGLEWKKSHQIPLPWYQIKFYSYGTIVCWLQSKALHWMNTFQI